MAWIESHQALRDHPKTIDLMALMGWDLDTNIGKLHRFWWWCVDYAEDGDLRKHNDSRLAIAVGLNSNQGKQFVEAMVKSGWIDREPYFRVHDWWDYIGLFLQRKYQRQPEKWQKVRDLYCSTPAVTPSGTPGVVTNLTNQPNQHTTLSGKPDLVAPVLYLNDKTNRNFDPKNKANQDLIRARYAEGRTLEQFKTVIDRKVSSWITDEKMSQYLRPSTLFNRTNFENYLNEPVKQQGSIDSKYFKKE